ncbi:MAG: recombinase family protein [Gemmataceae bacterium]|nr:recombinase family protein [Gemmataceae bacterium]
MGRKQEPKAVAAVAYYRVSSDLQEKEGFSIPAQQDLIRKYALEKGITVLREFAESETAKKAGREQFDEMVAFLKKNPSCRIILVEKTDRLYRNLKDYATPDDLGVEWRGEQEGLLKKIAQHQQANQHYMEEGVQLVEPTRRMPAWFEKQEPREKRRLLDFVLSNSTWANGKLAVEFRKPFDLLAVGNEAVKQEKAARGGSGGLRPEKLREAVSTRFGFVERGTLQLKRSHRTAVIELLAWNEALSWELGPKPYPADRPECPVLHGVTGWHGRWLPRLSGRSAWSSPAPGRWSSTTCPAGT